jgi:restriction system protein
MGRYYRRRSYKDDSDTGLGFIIICVIAFLYTKSTEFMKTNPYALPLLIVIVLVLVSLLFWLWWRRYKRARDIRRAFTIANIDYMEGEDFERYLADLLGRIGYTNIKLTEKYDLGVDIIAHKDGITWGIQAKRYNSMVGATAVRQVYTALTRYGCDRAMVVTNNIFSRPAKTLAQDTNCVLVDRDILSEWVLAGL